MKRVQSVRLSGHLECIRSRAQFHTIRLVRLSRAKHIVVAKVNCSLITFEAFVDNLFIFAIRCILNIVMIVRIFHQNCCHISLEKHLNRCLRLLMTNYSVYVLITDHHSDISVVHVCLTTHVKKSRFVFI